MQSSTVGPRSRPEPATRYQDTLLYGGLAMKAWNLALISALVTGSVAQPASAQAMGFMEYSPIAYYTDEDNRMADEAGLERDLPLELCLRVEGAVLVVLPGDAGDRVLERALVDPVLLRVDGRQQ